MTGSRTGKLAMQPTPSVTRLVAAVRAPSSAIESGRGLASRLSPTHSESNTGCASNSRASDISCSTVVTPKNTPRCGRVNPNLSVCVVIASLLDVPVHDGFHHEKIVLALGQDELRALQAEIGRAHHPHEGHVAREQLLKARIDLQALGRIERAAPGDDQPIHILTAIPRPAVGAEERVETHGGIGVEPGGPEEADGLELARMEAHAPERREIDDVHGDVQAQLFPGILVHDGHGSRGSGERDDREREALAVLLEHAVLGGTPARLPQEVLRLRGIVLGYSDLLVEGGQ